MLLKNEDFKIIHKVINKICTCKIINFGTFRINQFIWLKKYLLLILFIYFYYLLL